MTLSPDAGASQQQTPDAPRFWFSIEEMEPSSKFEDRREQGQWLPPRPLHSNVMIQAYRGRLFQFCNWSTQTARRQDVENKVHYKTCSLYHNRGHVWIYPADATRHKVGDGTSSRSEDDSSDSDSEKERSLEELEDWQPLSFETSQPNSPSGGASYCKTRGRLSTLYAQRRDQSAILELLPDRYHAAADRFFPATTYGGLVGDLPILLALTALSVSRDRVAHALQWCLGRTYTPHSCPRGEGCQYHKTIASNRLVYSYILQGNPSEAW